VDNRSNSEILTILITNGADINMPDNKGETPLQLAIRKSRTEMAELLRQHGAKE
jgi:ankyrin repeat protein